MTPVKNILITEDDPILAKIYVIKFEKYGYNVRITDNINDSVAMINTLKPDLILLDINLNGESGISLLKKFPKEQRAFKIIIVTNVSDPEIKEICQKLGCDDYLEKKDISLKFLADLIEKY